MKYLATDLDKTLFVGELKVVVEDGDGISTDCVKVYVTLDNGEDPRVVQCTLDHTDLLIDENTCIVKNMEGIKLSKIFFPPIN